MILDIVYVCLVTRKWISIGHFRGRFGLSSHGPNMSAILNLLFHFHIRIGLGVVKGVETDAGVRNGIL